jgi:NADPH:quinone reductase-like Zn-dependent oxidoreductase
MELHSSVVQGLNGPKTGVELHIDLDPFFVEAAQLFGREHRKRRLGATVLGIAGEGNADWLESTGTTPVVYGDGLPDRLRAAASGRVDAFIDCFGGGYVDLAIDQLGVRPDRVDTIIDRDAASRAGANAAGMAAIDDVGSVISELAALIEQGKLVIPVATTFALDDVRQAYTLLERRHTRGKIVLVNRRA